MKEDRSYGIILILRKDGESDRYLAVRQKSNGYWSFPKGHGEGSETPKESAKRELKEEAGITNITFADLSPIYEEYTFKDGDELYHKIVQYFIAFTDNDKVTMQPEEVIDYKWALLEDYDFFSFPEPKQILKEVKKLIK